MKRIWNLGLFAIILFCSTALTPFISYADYNHLISWPSSRDNSNISNEDIVSINNNSDTLPLVLIIASLDNNLGQYWEQVINSAEKAVDDNKHVRILLDGPGENNSYVYELTPDQNIFCPSIQGGDLLCGRYKEGINHWAWTEDVGHPASLYHFITEAMDSYPDADTVSLSLIGHGAGWSADILPDRPQDWSEQPRRWRGQYTEQPRRWGGQTDIKPDYLDRSLLSDASQGFFWDDYPNEYGGVGYSVHDLRLVLEGVVEQTGRKIDLLYFDACSMGMAEVAYELRHTVDYLLVSESTAWATFIYDQLINAVKPGMSGREIGEAWLTLESNLLYANPGYPFAMALYDQSRMQELADSMQMLSSALSKGPSSTQRALIALAAEDATRVESNYNGEINTNDSYIDLLDFGHQLQIQFRDNADVYDATQSVIDAVNAIIVRRERHSGDLITQPGKQHDFNNVGGISFYFPSHGDELKRQFFYNSFHLQWVDATNWHKFLDKWHNSVVKSKELNTGK